MESALSEFPTRASMISSVKAYTSRSSLSISFPYWRPISRHVPRRSTTLTQPFLTFLPCSNTMGSPAETAPREPINAAAPAASASTSTAAVMIYRFLPLIRFPLRGVFRLPSCRNARDMDILYHALRQPSTDNAVKHGIPPVRTVPLIGKSLFNRALLGYSGRRPPAVGGAEKRKLSDRG